MIDLFFSNKLARKLALILAGLSALPLTSCGPPGLEFQYDFGSGTPSLDTDTETETSDNVIEVQFAEDGSILGQELLMSEDGAFESEITFNDEEEEALEEARAQIALTRERLGKRAHKRARKSTDLRLDRKRSLASVSESQSRSPRSDLRAKRWEKLKVTRTGSPRDIRRSGESGP